MTTNNHQAHGPVSLDRLHQIREILSKAAAQSDGGNLGYAMADAVKVIDGAIAAFGAEPVGTFKNGPCGYYSSFHEDAVPLYTAPQPAPVVPLPDAVSVLLNHLEDVLPDDAFNLIDVKTWNAVSMLTCPDACRAAMLQAGNSPVTPDGSEDTKRLDWLDAQNKRLNEYYGTSYGWKFDANFQRNAMMLNDSNYPVMNVRQAIDEAIAEAPKQENI
ncbi:MULTISPECIES: hypothetical protein [unclassified Citrobacter]|uniref:hypothetical protein n=1 Tax=unclassified Citrobacter TaxID=2644389 RepID=UPI0025774091|nr:MULTISPECIES: hypothetical protein [unclassified Citrobacter]MDM2798187.1 hypothetical protein [Citrobacter sp. Cpo131]MDM2891511.1 hypothetical protein [Citrobacter sp. Cpo060]